MNRHHRFRILLLLLSALAILLVARGQRLQEITRAIGVGNEQVDRPLVGVAITKEPTVATATPSPEIERPGPTSTPFPTATVINLAGDLPDGEVFVIYVSRASGAFEMYRVPIAPLNRASNVPEAIAKTVNLGSNDFIADSYALATPPPKRLRPDTDVVAETVVPTP